MLNTAREKNEVQSMTVNDRTDNHYTTSFSQDTII
jgi:hypothetical protein